jgi:hypothetical protein
VGGGEGLMTPASERPLRIDRYLELAHDLSATAEALAERSAEVLRERKLVPTFKSRALTGLALKIDAAFEALLDDVEKRRREAMHHLKTMAESYIFFRAIGADSSDRTAELVLAEAWHRKVQTLEDGRGTDDELAAARRQRDDLLRGHKVVLHNVKELAELQQVKPWYWQVYRLACEPAHLGDLVEFMPDPPVVEIQVGGNVHAGVYRAILAVHYGISLMLTMFDEFNERNELGLLVPLDNFRARFDAITSEG